MIQQIPGTCRVINDYKAPMKLSSDVPKFLAAHPEIDPISFFDGNWEVVCAKANEMARQWIESKKS